MAPFILILITLGGEADPDLMQSVYAFETLEECHEAAQGYDMLETFVACIEGQEE